MTLFRRGSMCSPSLGYRKVCASLLHRVTHSKWFNMLFHLQKAPLAGHGLFTGGWSPASISTELREAGNTRMFNPRLSKGRSYSPSFCSCVNSKGGGDKLKIMLRQEWGRSRERWGYRVAQGGTGAWDTKESTQVSRFLTYLGHTLANMRVGMKNAESLA